MNRLKHFLITFILVVMLLVLGYIPKASWVEFIAPICFILTACVLSIGLGYMFYKKKLCFICVLILSLLASGGNLQAGWFLSEVDSEAVAEEYKKKLDELGPGICEEEDSFDPENLDIPPNGEDVEKAYNIMDMYDKMGLADIGGVSGAVDSYVSYLTFGLSKGVFNRFREYADCAESYLKNVSEWKKASFDSKMVSVPHILETDKDKCWPCGIASLVLEAAEGITFSLEEYLMDAALLLLSLLTLFWIGIRTMQFIGKLGTASNAEYFGDLLKRLILVAIVAAFLHAPLSSFFRITLSPLVEIGSEISNTISSLNTGSMLTLNDALKDNLSNQDVLGCSCCHDTSSNCNDGGEFTKKTPPPSIRLFENETKAKLMCMTCLVYKQMSPLIAAGQGMTTYSAENTAWWRLDFLPTPFGMYVFGLILIMAFSVLAFIVAFKLIDIFLQLAFVVILMPFLLALFPFPLTRKYTKKGWDSFVYVVLNLIGLMIGVSLLLTIGLGMLPEYTQNYLTQAMMAEPNGDYFENLYEVFIGGPNGGALFVVCLLLMSMLMGYYLINASTIIVQTLSGIGSAIPSVVGHTIAGLMVAYNAIRTTTRSIANGAKYIKDKAKSSSGSKASDRKSFEDRAANATKKAGDKTAKGIDKAGQKVGGAIGKSGRKAGNALMSKGAAASSTGLGAIAGIPMMIAGAAIAATATVAEIGIRAAAKGTALAIKAGSRAAAKSLKMAGKERRKMARSIKNRTKQVPSAIKEMTETVRKTSKRAVNETEKTQEDLSNRESNGSTSSRKSDQKGTGRHHSKSENRDQASKKYGKH